MWSAEAYGSDALSPLAYLAAFTDRIKLGTAVVQLAARPPTTLAMHAMTIDALAGGGRMILGIGVSGPQIVEGWYGQPWGHPDAASPGLRDHHPQGARPGGAGEPRRYRALVAVSRCGVDRAGQGAAVDHAPGADIPIWLASGGPQNTELCAEIVRRLAADGTRVRRARTLAPLESGWAKRGGRPADFEMFTGCAVRLTDDVAGVLDGMRPLTAMYVGGMGSATHNFHREAMARRGFPDEAASDPGAVAGRPQGRGGRRGARRVPRADRAPRATSNASDAEWASWSPPAGVTGLIVDAPGVEELRLARRSAGMRLMTYETIVVDMPAEHVRYASP